MFYIRKFKGIKVVEAWFQRPQSNVEKNYTTRFYQSMIQPVTLESGEYLLSKRDGMTLVFDLSVPEDELMSHYERDTRNKIRRAKKDGALCQHYTAEKLQNEQSLLQQFNDAYREMYQCKGLPVKSVTNYLQQLIYADKAALSTCTINGEIVVYHIYIVGDSVTRQLYSVSVYRKEDGALRNAIGRANRLLHYEDMLWFKSQGFHWFDFGGYSSDPAMTNINAFKSEFGGKLQPRYYAATTKSKALYTIYSLLKFNRGRS